jgi:hypothetical protein
MTEPVMTEPVMTEPIMPEHEMTEPVMTESETTPNIAPPLSSKPKNRFKYYFLGLGLIAIIGTAFFLGRSYFNQHQDESDALLTALFQAKTTSVSGLTATSSTAQLEMTFQNRLSIPAIQDAPLEQVAQISLQNVSLPVFIYNDSEVKQKIFVVNYQQLSRLSPLVLSPEALKSLEKDRQFFMLNNQVNALNPVIWRLRDDIYISFVQNDEVRSFTQRIRFS